MSTRGTLYYAWGVHCYHDIIDDRVYVEVCNIVIKLPKWLSDRIMRK